MNNRSLMMKIVDEQSFTYDECLFYVMRILKSYVSYAMKYEFIKLCIDDEVIISVKYIKANK